MTEIAMKDVLPGLTCGTAMGHGALTLVPLLGGGGRFEDYLLAAEALEAGSLVVTEIDEAGSVPELLASNQAENPVLLLDGEELQGAKQNRILNASVLLPAGGKLRVHVSCVEQGRWDRTSKRFRSGHYAPSSLRRRTSRDVARSLRAAGVPRSDQHAVWEGVEEQLASSPPDTAPTRAMSDGIERLRARLDRYCEALPYPDGACGIAAAIAGRFVAADLFDSPSTLASVWPRLVSSYALDAERSAEKPGRTFSAKAASVLLEHVADQRAAAFTSVGMGEDLRFEAEDVLGQALCVDGRLLHLSVFPPESAAAPGRAHGPAIRPPSRRRRRTE